VELVAKAKAEGLAASCEVSPHHLMFQAEDIDPGNTAFKMNPPIRSKDDRDFLREALQSGAVDFVATDHAPHDVASKGKDFRNSAFGTVGLDSSLRVLLTLAADGHLSKERLVEVFATRPAAFLGLEDSLGDIAVGRPFRAVLVEGPRKKKAYKAEHVQSKSKNSCFVGSMLCGEITRVFDGKDMYDFKGQP